MNAATLDMGQVAEAMEQIDAAQAVIAEVMATEAETEPVEAPAAAPGNDLVDVEVLRPVAVCVNGDHVTLAPGLTTITRGLLATIKQTHQADAVRG